MLFSRINKILKKTCYFRSEGYFVFGFWKGFDVFKCQFKQKHTVQNKNIHVNT